MSEESLPSQPSNENPNQSETIKQNAQQEQKSIQEQKTTQGPKKQKKGPRPQSKSKRKRAAPNRSIHKQFAACGRCSFFWAGYKLIDESLDESTLQPDHGWLTLKWDHAVRELIYKSYGNRVDLDYYYYEGCCSVCQRPFIYKGGSDESEALLRVHL